MGQPLSMYLRRRLLAAIDDGIVAVRQRPSLAWRPWPRSVACTAARDRQPYPEASGWRHALAPGRGTGGGHPRWMDGAKEHLT